MKQGLYRKLAWSGLVKNKQIYIPYLITCMGLIMMQYIMSFFQYSPLLEEIKGGRSMKMVMELGVGVISIFAVIFLLYSNSFLSNRRKKEFGLYNVLGMGKVSLVKIQIWESMIITGITLPAGVALGILFSKIAELFLINVIHGKVNLQFFLSGKSVGKTIGLFLLIYLVILVRSIWQIIWFKPIDFFQSEKAGEKPVKANWFLAVVGVLILAGAYYIAVNIENPLSAFVWFFIAVVMVIIATYFLFIAGSVALCKVLKKKKSYYYKTKHFVSVSSMVYRMKRNGAGLASICVLSTMVLVMLSAAVSLFIGQEDMLNTRFPRNMQWGVYSREEKDLLDLQKVIAQVLDENGVKAENPLTYQQTDFVGYLSGNDILTNADAIENFDMSTYEDVRNITLLSLEDYNRCLNKKETLEQGEALIYAPKEDWDREWIDIDLYGKINIKKEVEECMDDGNASAVIINTIFLVTPDYEEIVTVLEESEAGQTGYFVMPRQYYGFDVKASNEKQVEIHEEIQEAYGDFCVETQEEGGETTTYYGESKAVDRYDFYGIYGGIFCLGIFLGIIFVTAMVLIMYYKQISEGYEDQKRFEILQKVGMTKREIKQSINSQILTVFSAPLILAGVHLIFAFPVLYKLLMLLMLNNKTLLMGVTAVCYLVFALMYSLVYKITSGTYYRLVSVKK